MNYAKYATFHARHLRDKICLIERTPATNERRTLTWKQFNDEINKVANYLSKELGIKDGDYVMHLQNNSLEWLITYYGIIKIGAVIVPLNFRFVGPDILYAAEVCDPKIFFLGPEFLPVVQPVQKDLTTVEKYICVGGDVPEDMIDYKTIAASDDISEAIVDVDDRHDLAMMFTSGTTGKPKPVMHTHYSLNNTAIGNGMSYFVEKNDNYLFFLPLYHSGTMFLWAPFYATGATGTILRELKDPKWVIESMAEEKCTDVLFVVPIAVAILNAIKDGDITLSDYDLSNWKYMEIGAQPVPFDVMKNLVKTLPCAVSNIYGITEGGGGGTFNLYPEEVLKKPGSIGKPTFGVEGKIVDPEGKEVPAGEVGELIFTTRRMMKGYHNNPEMTAETLKDGWLYTGDLLKTDEEGYFYIVDRKKDMIISSGCNVYPRNIEEVLYENPKVQEACAIGIPHPTRGEAIKVFVALKEGETATQEELIEYCTDKLAKYKLPTEIEFRDELPKTNVGKILKKELREEEMAKRQK